MSFGKLYGVKGNARTTVLLAVAKANKLDIDLVEMTSDKMSSSDYKALNKLGKMPTFQGSDGYVLTESMAIAIYLTSQNDKTTLLGKTKKDYASILRWMSFSNSELLPALAGWYHPILGKVTFIKTSVESSMKAALNAVKVLDEHLLVNTYLVGERLTLADLFVCSQVFKAFEYVFDKKFRAEHLNFTRWFETVYGQDVYNSVAPDMVMADEALKMQPPKKEAAPKKEQPKKEAAQDDDDEDEAPAAPKAKHPLEELGRPTFVLDDWKRKYSNEETREVALPWFWENVKFDEYSLWRVDYKYNDELTMTFMTSNLIGGFFARLEGSRKYIFGAASVFGVTNDSIVQGAFLVRGPEAAPAFEVAPDHDSYTFTKLDPTSAADKTFVEDQWAWDKPAELNGKKYEWADGKVFK